MNMKKLIALGLALGMFTATPVMAGGAHAGADSQQEYIADDIAQLAN